MVRDIISYIRANYRNKVENDPGFGLGTIDKNVRFLRADGQPNVIRTGLPLYKRIDVFHIMLNLNWLEFILVVLATFFVTNLFFAGIYWLMGIDGLVGVVAKSKIDAFWEIFYFSAQTLTTVGYGRLSPVGHWFSAVAALESLLGLLGFALFTGLIYGRFAKPSSALLFSNFSVIAPYRGITAFMFRVANPKTSELVEAEVMIMLTLIDVEQQKRIYVQLNLERPKIMFLTMNWTIVHPIDENSPIVGLDFEELKTRDAEFIIVIKAFDETRGQNIYSRTSYKATDIKWAAKFLPMRVSINEKGTTIHDISTLNDYEEVELPY